jgi:uncharacterized protein YehS (DUF1456 family)
METNTHLIVRVDENHLAEIVKRAVREALDSSQAQYFNKKEAAKYLKISAVTLWSYQTKGLITPVHVGDREMFSKSELDRFASGVK